ncbi:MAG: hypothetical protein HY520_03435 [Candidatus Aenigmarchaeota archaeon]|nr:hypothetical protein [Candidatus Aenigmarchaeota archaeon]
MGYKPHKIEMKRGRRRGKRPEPAQYLCERCGKPTVLPFIPRGTAPILCKGCLRKKKKREEQEARAAANLQARREREAAAQAMA